MQSQASEKYSTAYLLKKHKYQGGDKTDQECGTQDSALTSALLQMNEKDNKNALYYLLAYYYFENRKKT